MKTILFAILLGLSSIAVADQLITIHKADGTVMYCWMNDTGFVYGCHGG